MRELIDRLVARFEDGDLSRRELVAGLAAIAAGGCAAAARPPRVESAPSRAEPIPVRGYSHAALRVSDPRRSAAFYREHFGMRVTSEGDRSAFLTMGGPFLALFAPGAGHAPKGEPGLDHLAFAVERWDFDGLVAALKGRGLDPWTQGGRIYFRDPDGIILQVSP